MGNLTNEVLRPIIDAINVPLILGLCLVVVIAVTRTASSLWYLVEHRGRRPLMIRMGGATGGNQNSAEHTILDDRLLAYLAADGQGGYVIAPGAGGPAAPGVTTEALEPSHGWPAALLRLAIAREPSYLVDVSWPRDDDTAAERRAVVRISRVPGDRVVASGSFTAGSDSELVEIVGCFCITFLRGQPRILRHTPRWERWSQDINGYRAYRDGLEHQRRGMVTRSIEEYEIAISRFHEAARIEPANMLVQLHRAALLELTHDYDEAVGIYSKCRTLWPEHIEAGYRLGNARKNAPDRVGHHEVRTHLRRLKDQLALSHLAMAWLRTFRPWRWNPGERHYWRSWLQLWLPGRVTKRAMYLHAVAIADLLAALSCLFGKCADCPGDEDAAQLMDRLARQILRRPGKHAIAQLLYPEHPGTAGHDHAGHTGAGDDLSWIPTYHGRKHRGNVGWLALFNTACFLSRAIKLAPGQRPAGFSQSSDWERACARAAIRELGVLVRHPRHGLEPDWLGTDPDLAPLRDSDTGKAWASFVGLSAPAGSETPGQPLLAGAAGNGQARNSVGVWATRWAGLARRPRGTFGGTASRHGERGAR